MGLAVASYYFSVSSFYYCETEIGFRPPNNRFGRIPEPRSMAWLGITTRDVLKYTVSRNESVRNWVDLPRSLGFSDAKKGRTRGLG